ncbi:MAG: GNAT family N-acetyltransferase [Bacteroidia bacterium]|nr:GNAT family N-acetyltransferase [Bacteroidia bacterium]
MGQIFIKKISCQDTWDLRHQVMWPEKDVEYVILDQDPIGIHYGLFHEDALISVISLFVEGGEMQFRKFATDAHYQGKGHGTHLLSFVMDKAEEEDIRRIWCNARKDKAFFYARFGMRETPHQFEKGGLEYVIMEKVISES